MSKLYHGVINAVDKYVPNKVRPLWEHPAGNFLDSILNFANLLNYF